MVGAEAPVTTFAEAACGYSLRRWGAIGLVVLDLARCGTVPTIERIGVGLGKAQIKSLEEGSPSWFNRIGVGPPLFVHRVQVRGVPTIQTGTGRIAR